MEFVRNCAHEYTTEDGGDVEENDSQCAHQTRGAERAGICWQVDRRQEKSKCFDDIAYLKDSKRRRGDEGKVKGPRLMDLCDGYARLDESQERNRQDKHTDRPDSKSSPEAILVENPL